MTKMEEFHQYMQQPRDEIKRERFEDWSKQHGGQWPIAETERDKARRELGFGLAKKRN